MTDIKDNAIIKQILIQFAVKTCALNGLLAQYLEDKLPIPATSLLAFLKLTLNDTEIDLKAMVTTNIVFDTAVDLAIKQYKNFLLKKENKEETITPETLH